jgi:nucleoside permease NupC
MVFSWTILGMLLISGVRYMIPDWKNGIKIHVICGFIILVLTLATSLWVFGVRKWVVGRRTATNEVYHDQIGFGKYNL